MNIGLFCKGAAVLALALVIAGCGGNKEKDLNKMGMAGAFMADEIVDVVDLVRLLDAEQKGRKRYGRRWRRLEDGQQVDLAFDAFYRDYPVENRELRRNRVQERLLGASNNTCERLKNYLLTTKNKSFIAGMAGFAAAAGRIATGINASSALSGVYGVFSDASKKFNKERFASLTTQVIVAGIEYRRQVMADAMRRERNNSSIKEYTVEAAVKDALYYHDYCNVFAGMSAARNLALESGLKANPVKR